MSEPCYMKKIWKYQLPIVGGTQTLSLPNHSKFLSVQMQYDKPVAWFEVYSNETKCTDRTFKWVATGFDEVNTAFEFYLGTVQDENLVFHLYEVLLEPDAAAAFMHRFESKR